MAGCDAFAAPAKEFNHRPVRQRVVKELNEGNFVALADQSFDAMFERAQVELRKKGETQMADQLASEWNSFGRDLLQMSSLTDVGDHDPFSEWVALWYAKLEAKLGVQIMELTHLRDIWVMNFTIPVVFHPAESSKWCVELKGDDCADEYRRHFAGTKWQRKPDPKADDVQHHGFAPVVTYWATWTACQLAGGSFACGPAGTAAEFIMERYFAPNISDRIFVRVNGVDGCDGISCDHCECDDCHDCEDCDCEDCDCPHCDHEAVAEDDESEV